VYLFQAMDPPKDIQPPKQQPMIYICGGNYTLSALSYVRHVLCISHFINTIMSCITMQTQFPSYNVSEQLCVLLLCFRVSHRKWDQS